MISPVPGGINGTIIPEAAVITVENGFEYPSASMDGTSILHSIAASAREDPDKPPISVDNRTLTCASPPYQREVKTLQHSMILLVTPV